MKLKDHSSIGGDRIILFNVAFMVGTMESLTWDTGENSFPTVTSNPRVPLAVK